VTLRDAFEAGPHPTRTADKQAMAIQKMGFVILNASVYDPVYEDGYHMTDVLNPQSNKRSKANCLFRRLSLQ
jgi:hypothetical protein